MSESTEIKLVQKPVISHQLKVIGESVTKRIQELDIDSLVATADTVKALKDMRADLNKELKNYEDQRKYIKGAINEPYSQFEDLYKTEISEKYSGAIEQLKEKIASVENEIKEDKESKVREYFKEVCAAEKVDFVTWEHLGIEINLSTSLKKYKEQVAEFVSKVRDDLELIAQNDHHAEILVEYKRTLNVAQAITTVSKRKEDEKTEQERIKQQLFNARIDGLFKMGFTAAEIGEFYEYKDLITISREDVKHLDKETWTIKLLEIESRIAEAEKSQKPAADPVSAPTTEPERQQESPSTDQDKVVTAKFQVIGKFSALKALGQYMRENNIKYQNL